MAEDRCRSIYRRNSWGQSKHSLEDRGELYMSTHIMGQDPLAPLDLTGHLSETEDQEEVGDGQEESVEEENEEEL